LKNTTSQGILKSLFGTASTTSLLSGFKEEVPVIKLYSSFSGSLSLTSYILNSQSQPLSPSKDSIQVVKKEALDAIDPFVDVISSNETNTSSMQQ
jgi:hypothetical protein